MVAIATQGPRRSRRNPSLKRRFSSASTNGRRKASSLLLSPARSPISRGRTLSVSPRHSPSGDPWYLPDPSNSLSISESSVGEEESLDTNGSHGLLSLRADAFQQAETIPRTYASLPPTPIEQSSPRPRSPLLPASHEDQPHSLPCSTTSPPPFSLWDYLREELLATDFDSHQEMKWERVSNFLNIPLAIEKVHHHSPQITRVRSINDDVSYHRSFFSVSPSVWIHSYTHSRSSQSGSSWLPFVFSAMYSRHLHHHYLLLKKPIFSVHSS